MCYDQEYFVPDIEEWVMVRMSEFASECVCFKETERQKDRNSVSEEDERER
jgi:hypothetical protein